MLTIEQWLAEYGESHQHKVNKLVHWICVPAIVFSILGLFWALPTPAVFSSLPIPFNWAIFVIVLCLLHYTYLSPRLAAGMVVVSFLMIALLYWADTIAFPVWQASLAVFVVAWIGQFIGHNIEGKKPAFYKDVQFLVIGPLWLLSFIYRKFGVDY